MDGSGTEHSDSDSGESWILLDQEATPTNADEAPELCDKIDLRNVQDVDKDEDTDGISIISDSDHDSTPCEIFNENNLDQESPELVHTTQYITMNPLHTNNNNRHCESNSRHFNADSKHFDDDDFLGDTSGKMKTYVHKRNKRLSTVLNVIMLGSVITAAGIAIGHMWGVRDDCSLQNTPSVNKILSNLYKLQEENAYLRNKLKELSLYNNIQIQQQKDSPYKHNRCKKVFEESLENKNAEKITRCVDNHNKPFTSHMIDAEYEKEFLNDIKKLKDVYKQNRSWLDEEISRRLKHEHATAIAMKAKHDKLKQSSVGIHLEKFHTSTRNEFVPDLAAPEEKVIQSNENNINLQQSTPETKITYADSLKAGKEGKITNKREIGAVNINVNDHVHKKKDVKDYDVISENSYVDGELQKDNRYSGHKYKMQRKKQDRQKINKKQKRKNKYEQWEMKGGYLKYYDDISATSSQENLITNPDKNMLGKDFELNNYMNQLSKPNTNSATIDVDLSAKPMKQNSKPNIKDKVDWYENRVTLRNEARKKLEKELFGENNSNPASWYFRRMQRREKCRGKADNNTSRRQMKKNMNFKTRC